MHTSLTTNTYNINLIDISNDIDNPTNYEITLNATLTRTYNSNIFDTDNTDNDITFTLNIAHRHANGIYYLIQNDPYGDYYDNYNDALYAFGQPIIDYIDNLCNLLHIPFYPNR